MKNKIHIIIYFLLFALTCNATKNTIDSLNKVLANTTVDSVKAALLSYLSFEYRNLKPDLCIEYADQSIEIANKIKSKSILVKAITNKGLGYRYKNDIKNALLQFEYAETICKEINDKKQLASIYNAIANLYSNTSKYSLAIDYHNKAIALRVEIKDTAGLALSLSNRANVYNKLGKNNEAATDLFSAIDILKKKNDVGGLALAYNTLGNIYFDKKSTTKKALEYYLTALNYFDRSGDEKGRNIALINIGNCHLNLDDLGMARSFYNQAKHFALQVNDEKSLALCYNNLGSLEETKKNYPEALKNFTLAMELYKKTGNISGTAAIHRELFQLYFNMGDYNVAETELNICVELYKETGQYQELNELYSSASSLYLLLAEKTNKKEHVQKCISYYQKHIYLRDSISKLEEQKSIDELQAAYDLKKKEAEIKQFQTDSELKNTQIEKQKQFIYLLAISSALFIALIFIIFKSNRRNKQANLALSKAYKQIEEKNKNISDSINYAKRIQEAILVPENEIKKAFSDAFVIYMPKDIVSGDFYWYGENENWKIIVVADCTGHGVPGGFMSMLGSEILQDIIFNEQVSSAKQALTLIDKRVTDALNKSSKSYRDGMDMALCALNKKTGKLNFAGANRSIIIVRNNQIHEYEPNKLNIGGSIDEQQKIFTDITIEYEKNDIIYLFTDGYADQFGGEKGKKFMSKKLRELLLQIAEKPMKEQKEILTNTYINWKGNLDQVDDVCIIGIMT